MTFRTLARRVRDPGLPLGLRYAALRSALEHYRSIGYHAGWAFITGTDPRKSTPLDGAALLAALDRLEAGRNAWLVEMASFAARRTALKRDGVPADREESRYRLGPRWPGPDARAATSTAVAYEWDRDLTADVPAGLWEPFAPLQEDLSGVVASYLGAGLSTEQRQRFPALHGRIREAGVDMRRHYNLWWPLVRLKRTAELVGYEALPLVRRGWTGDAEAITEIFWAARGGMAYLPRLHTLDETRWWIGNVMAPQSELWIAEANGVPVGFAALAGDWLDHLYIAPAHQGRGIGEALLAKAKRRRAVLDLHVFEQNTGARAFYARHGFSTVGTGDGTGNEEGLPDRHLRWRR